MPEKFGVFGLNFQKKKRRSLLFDLKNDLKNDLVKKIDLLGIGIRGVQKMHGG